jgi:FkbM family methyltransferase
VVLWDAFAHQYQLPLFPIKEDGTILDLGANVGYTVAHLATRFPKARVIGVEMDPENAEMARRNTRAFGARVQIVEGAVWTDDGEIHYGGDTAFGFRVSSVPKPDQLRSEKVAPAFNIETLCKEHDVSTIDFMKMDIEGAEAHVLYRNNDWLRRVNAMNLEVHTPAKRTDCMRHLQQFGLICEKHPTHPWGVIGRREG